MQFQNFVEGHNNSAPIFYDYIIYFLFKIAFKFILVHTDNFRAHF